MVPQTASVLPSSLSLPSADPRFRDAVDDAALIAGGLIAVIGAAMLAIPLPGPRWQDETELVVWDDRLAAAPALARILRKTPMFVPAFDALRRTADTLFARLEAWRWIDSAAPGLCLLTDGAGVVLSPERPGADAGCGWLLDRVRAGSRAITLRPPQADGAWSLIAAEAATLH